MRKKTLLLVIALMSISLIGLIGFQVYWIQHAVTMEEKMFDRNVNDALYQMARRLESKEALQFLKQEAPQLRAAALSPDTPSTSTHRPSTSPAKKKATKKVLKPRYAQATTPGRHVSSTQIEASAPPKPKTWQAQSRHDTDRSERIYLRGQLINDAKMEETLVYGKNALDSSVVFRIIASQPAMDDTLAQASRFRYFHKPRHDSTRLLQAAKDSLRHHMPKDNRWVHPKGIKVINVNGQLVRILSDSILPPSLLKVYTDSLVKGHTVRYYPAVKERNAGLPSRSPVRQDMVSALVKPTEETAPTLTQTAVLDKEPMLKAQAKAQHLNQVMQQMAVEYVRKEKPLPERLHQLEMKDVLTGELLNRNICTPFQYSLQTTARPQAANLVLTANTITALPANLRENEYAIRLFPNDLMTTPSYLLVSFPDRQLYLWQQLLLPSAMSLLFTLIILLTFSVTLYTILRQKKISEIKNDFINNMTHEFKTPIATISLALDALVNPKVRSDEARVNYYARIIKDENKRMHQQVEKVLQTAQMERRTLQLAYEELDVHQLIRKAVEPFQLHIEQRQGLLDLRLDATSPTIWADPGHLTNMVANLLDNANKYSPSAPKIVIQTVNIAKGLHISIEDNGAGMSRESQKRVFEKFYRVPTGNLHNVKGFGLGLSYVKTMVEAHAGTIHLRSELGKGSKFTLWLPYQKHAH